MVCMSLHEYGRAQLAFERIVQQINPNNDRARIELANAYLANKQYDQAKKQYEDVLARNPQAPEQVRANIERGLKLAKQAAKKWYFSGRVDAGGFHDNNVNVGPNSSVINIEPIVFGSQTFNTLTVDEGTLPMKSYGAFASAALSGAYDFGAPGSWMVTADGAYYQNWLKKAASSNESAFYQVVVGLRDSTERSLLKYPVRYAHVTRGGDALLDMYSFAPSYQLVTGKRMDYLLATDAAIELRDWSTLSERDGYFVTLGERFQHVIGQNKHSIGAGIGAFYDHTKARQYQNIGGALSLDGYLRLPAGFTLYARARYAHSEYAKKEELAPEKRKDDEIDLVGGLNLLVTTWWGVDVSYARTSNNSTFDLYQYDRDVATLSTFFTF
jgi:tetratricopeptide (TPR) repeat protein